jgi:hypothetical protein
MLVAFHFNVFSITKLTLDFVLQRLEDDDKTFMRKIKSQQKATEASKANDFCFFRRFFHTSRTLTSERLSPSVCRATLTIAMALCQDIKMSFVTICNTGIIN